MLNLRKGGSNAGANGWRRGLKKCAPSATRDFTNDFLPRAKSSAWPAFIANCCAAPRSPRVPKAHQPRRIRADSTDTRFVLAASLPFKLDRPARGHNETPADCDSQ